MRIYRELGTQFTNNPSPHRQRRVHTRFWLREWGKNASVHSRCSLREQCEFTESWARNLPITLHPTARDNARHKYMSQTGRFSQTFGRTVFVLHADRTSMLLVRGHKHIFGTCQHFFSDFWSDGFRVACRPSRYPTTVHKTHTQGTWPP